jgi:hypothetical protein
MSKMEEIERYLMELATKTRKPNIAYANMMNVIYGPQFKMIHLGD